MTRPINRGPARFAAKAAVVVIVAGVITGCGTGGARRHASPTALAVTPTASPPMSPPVADTPVSNTSAMVRPEESAAYVVNADGSGLRRLFSNGGMNFIETAPSPDGKTLAVTSRPMSGDEHTSLYLVSADDGSPRLAFEADAYMSLASWSPDGGRLIVSEQQPVATTPPSPPSSGVLRYRIFTPGTGGMSDPVDADIGQVIGWAADGSEFYDLRAYAGDSRIIAVNTSDLSTRTVVSLPGLTSAALSPDREHVAYAAPEPGGSQQARWLISVADIGSESPVARIVARTGTSSFGVYGLAWSPDGTELAYGWTSVAADRGIYVVPASGDRPARRITTPGDKFDVMPSWSPDGRWLLVSRLPCVACDGGGVQTIVAADDGSSVTALEPGIDYTSWASWAPAGATFAYGAGTLSLRSGIDPQHGTELARMPVSDYASLAFAGGRVFFVTYVTGADVLYDVAGDGSPATVLSTGYRMAVSGSGRTAQVDAQGLVVGDASGVRHLQLDFNTQVNLMTANPEVTWAPDEQRLAVALTGQDGDKPVGALIVVDLRPDGSWAWRTIDARAGIAGPRWSPDSSRLAYVAADGAYVVPVAGGPPQQLAVGRPGGVDWSPDGASLAVLTGTDVRIEPAGATSATAGASLASLGGGGGSLRWSPDGARIAAITSTGVAIISVADGSVVHVAGREVTGLAWSPGGAELAYGRDVCATQTCVQRLTAVNASGGGARDLVEVAGRSLVPLRWDDTGLVVASWRVGI